MGLISPFHPPCDVTLVERGTAGPLLEDYRLDATRKAESVTDRHTYSFLSSASLVSTMSKQHHPISMSCQYLAARHPVFHANLCLHDGKHVKARNSVSVSVDRH